MVSGEEQIPAAVARDFLDRTGGFGLRSDTFVAGWGMGETCTGITWSRFGGSGTVIDLGDGPGGTGSGRHGTVVSVGRPAPDAAVRIVDDEDAVVAENRVGRLQVSSSRVPRPGVQRR